MRVITLMRELNISLERLQSYESLLEDNDFKFNVVNQLVPENVYLQIVNIHKNIPAKEKKKILVFIDKENYRFNAKVKWYFNKQTDGEYGFAEKLGLPSIYFSGKTFLYSDPKKLLPGDELVVTIEKQDIDDRKEEIKAISVNSLWEEKDVNFLIFHFFTYFQNWNSTIIENILSQISGLSEQLNESNISDVENYVFKKIDYTEIKIDDHKSLYSILKICNIDFSKSVFLTQLSTTTIFNYWISCVDLILDFQLIKIPLLEYTKTNFNYIDTLINRVDSISKKEILDAVLLETFSVRDTNDFNSIVSVIKLYENHEIQLDLDKIPEELHLKLWENDIINTIPFNAVFNKLIGFKNYYYKTINNKKEQTDLYKEYFAKISSYDLKNLLARLYFDKDSINDDETFNTILFAIKCIPNNEFLKDFIKTIYDKSTPYYRLLLFIEDYTDSINYNEVVIYTGLITSGNQKLFLKKLIKLIAENKLELSINDLNRITSIDYQTNEYAKEIDGVGLDFTLCVILKLITDLKNKIKTSRTSIFDLVAKQIKTPKDLLVIDGFFEKCSGKSIIEENGTKKSDDGVLYTIYKTTKKEHFLPRFSTFCDGRKALLKDSTESALCKKSGLEFWWCENSQCYDICRKPHSVSQWRNYTLEDILQILKIPYEVTQYEILLNVINRVNRFLSHLTCRKCNTILRPKGKSNYAFYGVTIFSCNNQDCEEHANEIYLSHCLNGQCEDIIDSRDSVKCKTQSFGEECGWYICKNCNACCSSEKLKGRKSNLEKLGKEYNCHIEGHRDRGVICCSDCGHEMIEPTASVESYNKQLNWFIKQKDTNPNIISSGQRKKDGKWWFIWSRGSYSFEEYRKQIQNLFSNGFTIPDFNDKGKDNQLISEPFEEKKHSKDKVFVCPNCDHHFDLNNKEDFDYARKRAVQKFHINIFPLID
jgi:hypothetical protein